MKRTAFRRRLVRAAVSMATAALLVSPATAQVMDADSWLRAGTQSGAQVSATGSLQDNSRYASLGIAGTGAGPPVERTINLVTKNGTFRLVDNPPRSKTGRISAGDYFVFTSQAFTAEGDVRVGTSHGACFATAGGKEFARASFLCNGAFALDDGMVSWSWAGGGNQPIRTLGITGGTEAYEGARGSVRSEARADGTSLETIHLLAGTPSTRSFASTS